MGYVLYFVCVLVPVLVNEGEAPATLRDWAGTLQPNPAPWSHHPSHAAGQPSQGKTRAASDHILKLYTFGGFSFAYWKYYHHNNKYIDNKPSQISVDEGKGQTDMELKGTNYFVFLLFFNLNFIIQLFKIQN